MSQGMKMPKINIIDDDSLNAYASGINEQTYTVTLSKGIIEKLNDEELEGVIAHELTHIRNHDVRLLIISIVFVGIFSMLAQIALRSVYYSSWTRSRNDKNNGAILILVLAMIVAAIGYLRPSAGLAAAFVPAAFAAAMLAGVCAACSQWKGSNCACGLRHDGLRAA